MKKTAILLVGGLFVSCAVGGELTVGGSDGLSPRDALLKIRAVKAAGDKSPWTVRVKPGLYTLTETLTFTPADSGTSDAPVTWIGEGSGAVFSGGAVLGPWTDAGNGVWETPAPRDAEGKPIWFEQLWVNGLRMSRSRFPNEGYFHVCKKSTETKLGEGKFEHSFFFSDERVKKALAELSPEEFWQAQVLAIMKWSSTRRVLRRYDPEQGALVTYSPIKWSTYGDWAYLDEKEGLVCFENLRCGFDAPGEWLYDGVAGKILYRPRPDEKVESFKAVAPVSQLCQLVKFEGHPGSGLYVSNIRFENLTFAHSAGTPYDGNRKGPSETFQYQAAYFVDGAISARGARQITFDGCTVRNTGNYGMCFDDGTVSNRIVNCRFGDVGAGGIRMGARTGYVVKGEKLTRRVITTLAPQSSAFNIIDNCLFRHGGYFNPEGTAIAFLHISDSKILHCDISDFYYSGISVGFAWGYAGSVSQRNEIAFNRIGNLGKGVMSDMAGIYLLATSFGTTVHDNVIHDIDSYSYGGRGLYVDEGGEGIVFERNLVWNTTNAGLHQHYGVGCIYRNNIAAFSRQKGVVQTSRGEVDKIPSSLHVVGNIILSNGDLMVGKGVFNVPGVWANNLWFDTSGRADFGGKTWSEWQSCGKEIGGVYSDPLFVDAANFDFRLRDESPALKMGFRQWDYSRAGLRKSLSERLEPAR